MKRILPIFLMICLFLCASSVYAGIDSDAVWTADDIVYSYQQHGYICNKLTLEGMQSLADSLGAPSTRTYISETWYPYLIDYEENNGFSVFYSPVTYRKVLPAIRTYGNSQARISLTCLDSPDMEGANYAVVTYVSYDGSVTNYSGRTSGSGYSNNSYIPKARQNVAVADGLIFYESDSSISVSGYESAPIETINGGLVSLQSGNALVIDTLGGNISQIGLFTTLPVKSSVFSAFRSGASYFATNDLNSIKSIDFNTHAFTWDKQEGTIGLLGQTDKGVYTIYNPSGGRYLVIVNPRYMPRGSDHFLTNNPITVAISGTYRNLFRYSLSQSNATLVTLADEGESLIETDEGGTNSFGGSITFDDIPTTFPLPSDTPIVDWGTGNTPDYSDIPSLDGNVIGNAAENLQGINQNFSGFFGVIRECISWLPSQIISLLIAAMSLLVAVGIVKALL